MKMRHRTSVQVNIDDDSEEQPSAVEFIETALTYLEDAGFERQKLHYDGMRFGVYVTVIFEYDL